MLTGTYVAPPPFRTIRDLPPFDFQAIQAMLMDPEVRLCLKMRAAPISSMEFAYRAYDMNGKQLWKPGVEHRNPVIADWLLRQFETIWRSYLPGILTSQIWGWAAGEVRLRLSDANLIEIEELLPRHAMDCRLMEIKSTGTPWGIRVSGVEGGAVPIPFPYCYFVRFRPEDGEKYSNSILRGAFCPWTEKWLRGGALDTRRLFMHKDAYGGRRVFYPEGQVFIDGQENPIPARDVAMQIAEQCVNGGVITAPSTVDENGKPLWKIEEASFPSNADHILQYPKDLDAEIRRGLEIPDGAISNDGAGAWEGKSIPLSAFYAGLDLWVTQILADLRRTVDAIAVLNWGRIPEYEIRHKPLALQAMETQGAKRHGA